MTAQPDEFKHGWPTIVASASGACVGLTGLAFYTFGLFVKPLSAEFGWSRGAVALGLTFITLGTILTSPVVGWLTDRYGVRRVATPSLLGLALAYALLSRTGPAITSFYLACFAVSVLGCATSPVTWTRAVSLRFRSRRGLALGLTLLGSASASLLGAPLLQSMIVEHGWRAAYLAMAAFTVVFAVPMVLFFLRGEPRGRQAQDATLTGASLAAAARTAPFWTIAVAIVLLITAQSGVLVHLVPLLTDRGLSPVEAAGLAGLMGASIFVSRVVVGALLDRFDPPIVAGLVLLAPVAAAVILAVCGASTPMLAAAILLLGLSAGAEIDLLSFFAGRHFGLRSYGKIYGLLFAMFSVGNGLGAPLVGAAFDHWGDYVPALWAAAALFAIGAALFASLRLYPIWPGPDIADAGRPDRYPVSPEKR